MKAFLTAGLLSSLLLVSGMGVADIEGDDPPPLGEEEVMKKFDREGVLVESGEREGTLWRFLSQDGKEVNVIVFRRGGGGVVAGGWISGNGTGENLSSLSRAVVLTELSPEPVDEKTLTAWADGAEDDSEAVDLLKRCLGGAMGAPPDLSLLGVERVDVNIQTFTVYDVGQTMTNLDKIAIDNSDTVVMRWGMLW
jgi:hypothetical protein